MKEITNSFATFLAEHWKEIFAWGLASSALIFALVAFLRHGGRRSSKRWLENYRKEGPTKWKKVSLTRKPETFFTEGWAKSSWARSYSVMITEFDHSKGVVYHIQHYCVEVIHSHLVWRSALGLGGDQSWHTSETFEGVSLEDGDEVVTMVEKKDEIVSVEGLPKP